MKKKTTTKTTTKTRRPSKARTYKVGRNVAERARLAKRDKILELHTAQYEVKEIAAEVGFTPYRVSVILRKHGRIIPDFEQDERGIGVPEVDWEKIALHYKEQGEESCYRLFRARAEAVKKKKEEDRED